MLNRNFTSLQIGKKWFSDITYVRIVNQWNYVTTILYLADRKIVAWVLSYNMTTENTVYSAWVQARKKKILQQSYFSF